MHLDLSHPAIETVSFSSSKTFNKFYRCGIAFSHIKNRLNLQTSWHHGIHLHTYIVLHLMKKFGPDTQYIKFRKTQEVICEMYNLIPSSCAFIGMGDDMWKQYHRDKTVNRVCISRAIEQHMVNNNDE